MENNDLIAKFMGYDKVTIGYFEGESETQWQRDNQNWLDKVGLENIGDYYVNVLENKFFTVYGNELWYGEWNNLMNVIEKIENMGYLTSITKYNPQALKTMGFNAPTHLCSIWGTNFKPVFDGDGETKIQAVYDSVMMFIEWYNENNK